MSNCGELGLDMPVEPSPGPLNPVNRVSLDVLSPKLFSLEDEENAISQRQIYDFDLDGAGGYCSRCFETLSR